MPLSVCRLPALDVREARINIRRIGVGPRSASDAVFIVHNFLGTFFFSKPLRRMMMAHDSSHTPPSRLDDDTVAAVQAALRAYLAPASEAAALQGALLRMSEEARARDMRPEQLLVVLKDLWGALPEVRSMTNTSEQVRLLQRVVTMCIQEYYRG